jgi:4-aminobutyrate aminotransferase-like enzyme
MVTPSQHDTLNGPCVRGDLPGPHSAELLSRQSRRESNARVYPRHLPIAIADAAGSFFVRDVDGNVFIDFLNGAGVLPLGHSHLEHSHPELVQAVTKQLGRVAHDLSSTGMTRWATFGAAVRGSPGRSTKSGTILKLGGCCDCVVRMLPPLNVTEDVVDIACAILVEALREFCPSVS